MRKSATRKSPSRLHCLTASLLLAFLAALPAHAQTRTDFPTRPVRWLVGFAPGASNDIIARLVAARLSESLNQQVIVDNRSGAGGMIAGEIVAKGTPDGHTVLLSTGGPSTIAPLLTQRAPYRVDEFTQVITIGYAPFVVVAHPAFPPRNPAELLAYAKANPGKVNWGSSGTGGSPHYGLLILQAATGMDVTHVPFKGSAPSLVAIAAGQIQAMLSTVVSAEALLNAKRVKIIGVAATKRLTAIPDVPTFAELGYSNAESQVWWGMAAPPKTPKPIVGRLNSEVNKILQGADSVRRLRDLGVEILGGTPEQATQFVAREAANVAKFIKEGRLTPD